MNELRPEIAPLAAAVTHAERAKAVIMMSDSTLMTCEFTIRNRLMTAGFRAGITYLDAALALLRTPRSESGAVAEGALASTNEAWQALRAIRDGEGGNVQG